jgi:hypothetical protein
MDRQESPDELREAMTIFRRSSKRKLSWYGTPYEEFGSVPEF